MTQPITPPAGDPPTTTPTTPPANPPAPTVPPAGDPPKLDDWDTSTGKGGKAAVLADLATEREARKKLEQRFNALATALGDGDPAKGKSDVELLNERFAEHEKALTEERTLRLRLEVAAEKALTPAQAARLAGSTRDELLADADALVALFPAAAVKPGTPAPDPSQGSRGGAPDVETKIAEAQKKGDWRTVISLQNEKLTNSF